MLVEFSQCLQTVDGDAYEEAVESLVNLCVGYFVWDVAGADVGLCCPGEVADFFSVYCIEWVEVGVGASLYFDENDAGSGAWLLYRSPFADSCVGFDDCIAFGCEIFAGDVFRPIVRCRCVWPL